MLLSSWQSASTDSSAECRGHDCHVLRVEVQQLCCAVESSRRACCRASQLKEDAPLSSPLLSPGTGVRATCHVAEEQLEVLSRRIRQ